MQTLARSRSTRQRSLSVDLVVAVMIGLAAALAKRYLDFHLGIPGHAGVGWIAVLISGRLLNGRAGMATVAGLSMGLWGAPVGLGHSIGYNMMLYGLAGSLLDSGTLLRLPMRRLWGATLAGVVIHLAKFGFVFANAWISDIVRRVEIFGLLGALANHLVFGAAGGMLGWAMWRAGGALHARRIARRSS
jgi:hypothetical protein